MRRAWIKIHCRPWLQGSLRKEHESLRGIFADILAAAGDSDFGPPGEIWFGDEVGFTDEQFAGLLKVPLKRWLIYKERLSNHPDPKENRISFLKGIGGYGIKVLNFPYYQSDYERQKPYRKKKEEGESLFEVTPPSYTSKLQPEVTQISSKDSISSSSSSSLSSSSKKREEKSTIPPEFLKTTISGIIEIFKEYKVDHLLEDKKFFDYLVGLCWEFRDLDLDDEIKGKITHWMKKPPTDKSNILLQFRTWFKNARRYEAERQKEGRVGGRKK